MSTDDVDEIPAGPETGRGPEVSVRTYAIRKVFGTFVAVDEIDLEIRTGENFALLGPNGAGKSTLIRMLTTLTEPSAGTAEVAGYDVTRDAQAVRRAIGVVPQALTSDPDLTAFENLQFFARLYRVPRSLRGVLSEELLASVDLSAWRNKLVGTFSGGMRRRLEIARSLMHQPQVLFLDEPTTGLDPASRLAMWEMIRQLKARTGLTILLTTHYMEEAEELCDRVAIIDDGRLVGLGTPEELQAGIPGLPTVDVRFGPSPPDWSERLAKLTGVEGVAERNGTWFLATADRMTTAAAVLRLARKRGVVVLSLVARGRTLEDVFIEYTGRDTRDAAQKRRVDLSHLYERGAR